ncbi:MAG: glycosyltransferase [Desulfocapsaceae bacterium]|jgi:glycosyltransferase involved in cell wall biosynthesis|nr:glycosyltransferase [Desulfocapsaceae bacterium]
MISVIIPAYNHERFIGAAIESVLGQTWTDLELIVIDDGSTDRTGTIIQGYKDSRLTYLYQENQDAFNTINRGLGLAKGDYVAILNSDDVYTLNRLERLVATQKQTGAQCLFTDVIPISDSGAEFIDPAFGWNVWHQKNRSFFAQCGDLYTAFLKGNFMVTTSNLFMTAQAVKKVGKFCSLRYLHDYDFIFRMMLAFPDKVHYLQDEKLLYYRIHDGNTLGEAAITGREQDRDVIRKYMLARVPDALQGIISAGTDRLIELEHELYEVRNALHNPAMPGIKQQIAMLTQSISARLTLKGGN